MIPNSERHDIVPALDNPQPMKPTAPPDPKLIDLDFTKWVPPDLVKKPKLTAKQMEALQREVTIGTGELGTNGYYVTFGRHHAASGKPRTGPARIVCVDDDAATRNALVKLLTASGYRVVGAGDAKELTAVLRTPPVPDAILLDVDLPDLNGFDIVQRLRAHPHFKDVPIVMFTGHGDTEHIMRGLTLGVDGYVTKPATLDVLKSTLATVLR